MLLLLLIGASLSEPHTYRTAAKNLRHIYIYILYMFFIYIYIHVYIYIYTSVRPATRKRTTGTTGNVQPAGREYNLRCNHNIFCAVHTAL